MNQQLNEVNKQLGGMGEDLMTRKIKKKKKLIKNRDKMDLENESKSSPIPLHQQPPLPAKLPPLSKQSLTM